MPSQRVRLTRHYAEPPAAVFPLFADHARFGALLQAPIRRIQDGPGADPNGVGSVRRIGIGPPAFEETVTRCEAPTRIEYRVTRGSPLKNHHGRIEFAPGADGGTELTYTIDFDPRIPGTGGLLAAVLRTLIGRGLRRVPGQI